MSETKFYNRDWFQRTVLIVLALVIVYAMAYAEIIHRAKVEFRNGEEFERQGDYRQALWSYQAVLDFYDKPESNWLRMAREKVKFCQQKLDEQKPKAGEDLFPQVMPEAITGK